MGDQVVVRDITFNARDDKHGQSRRGGAARVAGVRVVHVSDRTFLMHLGGKIEVRGKVAVKTRDDLSMAYTPGVARVCMAIHEDPQKAYTLTIKQNAVAVVTDGTAVLGLGDIGPKAAIPVMEGKALLFKEFAGVDAFPLCLATKDVDEIVGIVRAVSPIFGGINLEDISAPRCFEIEDRLRKELDIPVFHDDQHGTAVVVLAALLNALKVVKKKLADVRVVFCGAGASGIATAKLLMAVGCRHIIGCDRAGTLYAGRHGQHELREDVVRRAHEREARARARSATRSRARTCSSASPAPASSPPRTSGGWPRTPSCSRWPIPCPRSSRRRCGEPSPSWRRAGPTIRTRSTTCSASPASSAGCSTCARVPSTTR